MSTFASGDAPYCTVQGLCARVDQRFIAQICSDIGVPLSSLIADGTVDTLLREASGRVEAACTRGGIYVIDETRNDLESITGNSKEYLAGLVAHITLWLMWCRRPNLQLGEKPPAICAMAFEDLDRLGNGELLFGKVDNQRSSVTVVVVAAKLDDNEAHLLSVQADRLLGVRNRTRWLR